LEQAIANAKARLNRFEANEAQILRRQEELQNLADEMDDGDTRILKNRDVIDPEALVKRKAKLTAEINQLNRLEAQLDEQRESCEEKKQDLEKHESELAELERELADRNNNLKRMRALFRLATDPSFESLVASHNRM
jgi:chromosome segregation ATPase